MHSDFLKLIILLTLAFVRIKTIFETLKLFYQEID